MNDNKKLLIMELEWIYGNKPHLLSCVTLIASSTESNILLRVLEIHFIQIDF